MTISRKVLFSLSEEQLDKHYQNGHITRFEWHCAMLTDKVMKKVFKQLHAEGKSDKTLMAYLNNCNGLKRVAGKQLHKLDTDEFVDLMAKAKNRYAARTVKARYSALCQFYRVCLDLEIIEKSPIPPRYKLGKLTQKDKAIRTRLTDDIIRKIFEYFESERVTVRRLMRDNPSMNRYGKEMLRNLMKRELAFKLLRDTGGRTEAIRNIYYNSIDFQPDGTATCLVLVEKGRTIAEETTVTMLMSDTVELVQQYVAVMPKAFKNNEVPLIDRHEHWIAEITRELNQSLKNVGIIEKDMDFQPRDFRRYFITNALNKGVPIEIVQQITRHKSRSTVQLYHTGVDVKSMRKYYDQMNRDV